MDEFEALLASSRTAVERWVKARVSGRADAEDILQDTYMVAFQGFSSLRSREAFLPWILTIARRKYADWCRARAKSPLVFTDTLPERAEEAPEDTAVEETLEKLSEKDRLMLLLFYREMLSQKQISLRLGIPEGTVKSRMNAARSRFRDAYPDPPKGGKKMNKTKKPALPDRLPEYAIVWKDEPPFPVVCEELMGWFIVPKLGEKLVWGMYDLPSRRLDVSYEMSVLGPAKVHGLDGVAIRARVLPPKASIAENDPMKDAVAASTGGQEEWTFIAQEKDGYTRFLSAEHMENGVRTLTTFLDGDEFMNSWGFGEDNRGSPIHLEPKGKIVRSGAQITANGDRPFMDLTGRCELTLDGKVYDTVCLMDLGMYEEGMVSEQYLGRDGRTVLWRRFNRDDWAVDRYGKNWSALLPENERIIINGQTYVHWYDCLCLRYRHFGQ